MPPVEENRRILIVDDEPEIRLAYKRFLSPEAPGRLTSSRLPDLEAVIDPDQPKFTVVEAATGDEALQIVLSESQAGRRFAAAIVDVRMPGSLDGLQFIQEAWRIDRDLIVVVATAYQDRSVDKINKMFGPGFQDQWDYLNKPFTSGEIIQKARQMVSAWNRREREKQYLKQIESQQKALIAQEQLAAVGRLARAVGHDLGNILQQVMTKVELAPHNDYTNEMIEAVELGTAICQNLLSFATHERENHEPTRLELLVPIEKALRLLRHDMQKKDIHLDLNVVPEAIIRCHEGKMTQVFINLITNSIQAMSDGGNLGIYAVKEGERIVVKVTDTGSGIAPEHMKKLFEPLFTTKGLNGNGIGLNVCKSIVENYDGQISVESALGKGTTVRMSYPL